MVRMHGVLVASAVGLLLTLSQISSVAADEFQDSLNDAGNCGQGGAAELCFSPTVTLGPFQLVNVDPQIDPGGAILLFLGIVRLTVVDDLVELPATSADSADLCAPFSLGPFPCEVVVALPVTSPPSADPQVLPGPVLGSGVVGTLTVKSNGQTLAVLPGFATVIAGCAEESSHSIGFDLDCDGFGNGAELAANSNPFYKYSTPRPKDDPQFPNTDKGRGFLNPGQNLGDWDGDGRDNDWEPRQSPRQDPFHRCSQSVYEPGHPQNDPVFGHCGRD